MKEILKFKTHHPLIPPPPPKETMNDRVELNNKTRDEDIIIRVQAEKIKIKSEMLNEEDLEHLLHDTQNKKALVIVLVLL